MDIDTAVNMSKINSHLKNTYMPVLSAMYIINTKVLAVTSFSNGDIVIFMKKKG